MHAPAAPRRYCGERACVLCVRVKYRGVASVRTRVWSGAASGCLGCEPSSSAAHALSRAGCDWHGCAVPGGGKVATTCCGPRRGQTIRSHEDGGSTHAVTLSHHS
eukprot:1030781-Prymnesium_polylepis.1